MKALSVRQPWAWLIVNGHKDIENRTWTNMSIIGETVLIHASSGMTRGEYEDCYGSIFEHVDKGLAGSLPVYERLNRGGFIGSAKIVAMVRQSESPWFSGPVGFVLSNAKTMPFCPFKGSMGFFDVPDYGVRS